MNKWLDGYKNKDYQFVVDDIQRYLEEKIYLDGAYNAYNTALRAKENRKKVEVMYETADVAIKFGNFSFAIEILRTIVTDYPTHPLLNKAVFSSAIVMKQASNYNQAGAYFQYIIDDPPAPYSECDMQFAIARLLDQEGVEETASEAWKIWFRLYKRNAAAASPKAPGLGGGFQTYGNNSKNMMARAPVIVDTNKADSPSKKSNSNPATKGKGEKQSVNTASSPKLIRPPAPAVGSPATRPMSPANDIMSPKQITWAIIRTEIQPWVEMGVKYENNIDFILALDAYSVALQIDPTSHEVWFLLAKLHRKMMVYSQAISCAGNAKLNGSHDMSVRQFLKDLHSKEWMEIMEKEEKSATKIQKVYKGYKMRVYAKNLKVEYTAASLKIQSVTRGALGRKKAEKKRRDFMEQKARKYLVTLMKKWETTVFRTWKLNAAFSLSLKRQRWRALLKKQRLRFDLWCKYVVLWKAEKRSAAIKIQKFIRGHIGRLDALWEVRINAAATVIQSVWRMHKLRTRLMNWKRLNSKSALTIQRVYRGWVGRKLFREEKLQVTHKGLVKGAVSTIEVETLELMKAKVQSTGGDLARFPRSSKLSISDLRMFFTNKSVIIDVEDINTKDVTVIADLLAANDIVETLLFCNGEIGARGVTSLMKACTCNKTLQTLGIAKIKVEKAAGIISEALPNTFFHNLYLESTALFDKGAIFISRAIPVSQTLRKLLLSDNGITDEGAAALGEALSKSPHLKMLGLSENRISDKGVQSLATGLASKDSKLTSLWLRSNSKLISNVGAQILADVVQSHKHLTELDLSGNLIADDGAVALSHAVSALTSHLSLLMISDNIITDVGGTSLMEAVRQRRSHGDMQIQLEGNLMSANMIDRWEMEVFNERIRSKDKLSGAPDAGVILGAALIKVSSPKRVKLASSSIIQYVNSNNNSVNNA